MLDRKRLPRWPTIHVSRIAIAASRHEGGGVDPGRLYAALVEVDESLVP
jgi:hypothetical protein